MVLILNGYILEYNLCTRPDLSGKTWIGYSHLGKTGEIWVKLYAEGSQIPHHQAIYEKNY